MGAQQVAPLLLELLHESREDDTRMEIALALSRLIGEKHSFINLLHQARIEPGTTLSQAITPWVKKFRNSKEIGEQVQTRVMHCREGFANNDLDVAARELGNMVRLLPSSRLDDAQAYILQECVLRLDDVGATRLEYILLALKTVKSADFV